MAMTTGKARICEKKVDFEISCRGDRSSMLAAEDVEKIPRIVTAAISMSSEMSKGAWVLSITGKRSSLSQLK